MKKNLLPPLAFALCISACGPSRAEAEAKLSAYNDSINRVQLDIDLRAELVQQLITLKNRLAHEQALLTDTQKLKQISSAIEKAEHIENQQKIIEELKSNIDDLQKQLK